MSDEALREEREEAGRLSERRTVELKQTVSWHSWDFVILLKCWLVLWGGEHMSSSWISQLHLVWALFSSQTFERNINDRMSASHLKNYRLESTGSVKRNEAEAASSRASASAFSVGSTPALAWAVGPKSPCWWLIRNFSIHQHTIFTGCGGCHPWDIKRSSKSSDSCYSIRQEIISQNGHFETRIVRRLQSGKADQVKIKTIAGAIHLSMS